jgi:hypothetical protein
MGESGEVLGAVGGIRLGPPEQGAKQALDFRVALQHGGAG